MTTIRNKYLVTKPIINIHQVMCNHTVFNFKLHKTLPSSDSKQIESCVLTFVLCTKSTIGKEKTVADQEHLNILQQGKDIWNSWRGKHKNVSPNLSEAKLSRSKFTGTHFDTEILNSDDSHGPQAVISFNFRNTNFSYAYLAEADLTDAVLIEANLSHAKLAMSQLVNTTLRGADLKGADLRYADLTDADLAGANLTNADLTGANLTETNLARTNMTGATISGTQFNKLDLRETQGIETMLHRGPSFVSTSTIEYSEGNIPEAFLRGAGLSDTFITYARSLVQSPIQYYTCFISYSNKNQDFAERLYADLQSRGVRCWYAPEDMKTGDKIRHRIDTSIRLYDKLLLILSEASVESQWVEHEVETAIGKELEGRSNVLFSGSPGRCGDAEHSRMGISH